MLKFANNPPESQYRSKIGDETCGQDHLAK
jgi:hypothetical protein